MLVSSVFCSQSHTVWCAFYDLSFLLSHICIVWYEHTLLQKKTKHSRVGQFPLNIFLLRGIDCWLVYYLSIPSRYTNFEHNLFKIWCKLCRVRMFWSDEKFSGVSQFPLNAFLLRGTITGSRSYLSIPSRILVCCVRMFWSEKIRVSANFPLMHSF